MLFLCIIALRAWLAYISQSHHLLCSPGFPEWPGPFWHLLRHPSATTAFLQLLKCAPTLPTRPLPETFCLPSPPLDSGLFTGVPAQSAHSASDRKPLECTVTWRPSLSEQLGPQCVRCVTLTRVNLCLWWTPVRLTMVRITFPSFLAMNPHQLEHYWCSMNILPK